MYAGKQEICYNEYREDKNGSVDYEDN